MSEKPYNVQRVKVKGADYLYFRRDGSPRVKLKSPWPEVWEGSELKAEVDKLLSKEGAKPAHSGTLKAAIAAYENGDLKEREDSTQALYQIALDEFSDDLGDLPLTAFTSAFICDLRDAWKPQGYRAANVRLQVLKNVLWPSIERANAGDPFATVAAAQRPRALKEPHPIWPEHVVTTVIEAAIADRQFGLARGVAIARYAGARRGDAVKITDSARVGGHPSNQPRRFVFLSGKRKVKVDMPEDPTLTYWLERTPTTQPLTRNQRAARKGVVQLPLRNLVYNTRGRRFTDNGFGQALAALVDELFKDGRIDADHYDAHGLRHSFGVELAVAGCTDAEGGALMGHRSPNSFATYRRQADRLRLSDSGAEKLRLLREQTKPETAVKPL